MREHLRAVRRSSALAVALTVVVAACGAPTDEQTTPTSVATTIATATTTAPPPTTTPATVAVTTPTSSPTSAPPSTSQPAAAATTTAPVGVIDAAAAQLLATAFERYEPGDALRVTSSTGQEMRVAALGIDTVVAADPTQPIAVVEVAPNGDQHVLMHVGQLFAPLASGDAAAAGELAGVDLELWVVGDTMTIDSTDYAVVSELNPSAILGPFTPGVGTVDLVRIGDIGGPELVQALVGSSVPDLATLGERLPAALASLEQDPADPLVLTGIATHADILAAQGTDVRTVARSAAAGIAPNLGLPVDVVGAFYEEFYRTLQAEVTVTLDADGALSSMRVRSDLGGIWQALFTEGSGLDLGVTADQLAEARAAFADAVWIIDTVSTFEADPSIVITPPPGEHEDRTEAAAEFFASIVG